MFANSPGDCFANQEIHAGKSDQQDSSFEKNRPVMQFVEFEAPGIVLRGILDGNHLFF